MPISIPARCIAAGGWFKSPFPQQAFRRRRASQWHRLRKCYVRQRTVRIPKEGDTYNRWPAEPAVLQTGHRAFGAAREFHAPNVHLLST